MHQNQPQLPVLVTNPHTGQSVNVARLLTYLHEQATANGPNESGAQVIASNLRAASRLIAIRPLDPTTEDPTLVANILRDLFDLEDVFTDLTPVQPAE